MRKYDSDTQTFTTFKPGNNEDHSATFLRGICYIVTNPLARCEIFSMITNPKSSIPQKTDYCCFDKFLVRYAGTEGHIINFGFT